MSSASMAPIFLDSMSVAAAPTAMQPTAQQAARFEQLLQHAGPTAEPAQYGAPVTGLGSNFHAMADYVGDASRHLRANLEPAAPEIDLQGLPPELQHALQVQREINQEIRDMGHATMEFTLIGKSVELVENAPKVLYQQG